MAERLCFSCMRKIVGEACSCEESKRERGYYPSALKPGTRLKNDFVDYRYTLGHAMGAGGFGIVYVALDEGSGRKVAIKEFFPHDDARRSASDSKKVLYDAGKEGDCEARRNRFYEEAMNLARFKGAKNIVSIVDVFQENNTAYIVMEYVSGVTLSSYIEGKGVFTKDEILQLMEPVMVSLAKVHKLGIIHRDISPDNIMIGKDESGKNVLTLIDFGAASEKKNSSRVSRVVRDSFSASELYRGENIGPWSDVYSLCATIYYCLTGQAPLDADYRKEYNKELVAPNECPRIREPISKDFEKAIVKGLSISRNYRQQSIEELMVDLGMKSDVPVRENVPEMENVEEEIENKEENAVTPKSKTKKTKRKTIIAGIAIAVLLVVCLVVVVKVSIDTYKKNTSKGYEKVVVLENVTVTYKELASRIGRITERIEFKGCSFEEGALRAFDKSMPQLYSINFTDCVGADYSEIDFSVYKELNELSFINSGIDDLCANAFAGSENVLDNIDKLIIREPEIKDFSFINQITSLYTLDICSNSIAMNSQDVGDGCRIMNLRLGGYSEVVELSLDTVSAISNMNSLYYVKLENMAIPEDLEEHLIPMFADLKNLDGVDVSNCGLKSLNLLSGAEQLIEIIADNNELTNLDSLERLIRLEKLSVCNNGLTDISGLNNCTVLRNVFLRNNNIADISVLAKSAATINKLDVSENVLLFSGENLDTVLTNKTIIESLQELNGLNISNIGWLEGNLTLNAKNIATLHADGCGLFSIKNKAGFDNIIFADISNNMIHDSAVFDSFKKATTLLAGNNEFDSLGSVSDVSVRYLALTGNNLSEMPQSNNIGHIIMLDYNEKMTTQDLQMLNDRYVYEYINNVPLDKQVEYESIFHSYVTFDENEEETNNYISDLKMNSINDMFNAKVNNFDDVELVKE